MDYNSDWFARSVEGLLNNVLAGILVWMLPPFRFVRRRVSKWFADHSRKVQITIPMAVTVSMRPSVTADLLTGSIVSGLDGASAALIGTSLPPPPRRPGVFQTTDDHYVASNALIQSRKIAHTASG